MHFGGREGGGPGGGGASAGPALRKVLVQPAERGAGGTERQGPSPLSPLFSREARWQVVLGLEAGAHGSRLLPQIPAAVGRAMKLSSVRVPGGSQDSVPSQVWRPLGPGDGGG